MSKELTPLEWLNYYKNKLQVSGQTIRPNGFDIIENALKDYERRLALAKEYKDVNNVAKRLKALEIIKEKVLGKWLEYYKDYKTYDNETRFNFLPTLSKEEYDLLKEILK